MASDWIEIEVNSIAATERNAIVGGPFGSDLVSKDYVPAGVPVIRGQNLSIDRWVAGPYVYVSNEKADRLSANLAKPGDLVFTQRGNAVLQGGQVAIVPKGKYERYLISQSQMKLTPDLTKADPVFLLYVFRSQRHTEYLRNNAVVTGVPHTNLGLLRSFSFQLPSLTEQRRIADILGTLDDKIELNRRMNETLEAMARRLFKSWFIDFDPVHAKAALRREHPNLSNADLSRRALPNMAPEIAELFPDSFEDSTLGPIPKGWRVSVLDGMTEMVIGGDWGKDIPCEEFSTAVFCIRGADIPDLQSSGLGKMPTRYLKPSSVLKRGMRVGDLAFEISGGSPTQSTGRPVLVTPQLLDSLPAPLTCSNFCRLVRPADPRAACFLYYYLRHLYDSDEFLQYENGTTGIKNFAFATFSSLHGLVVPTSILTAAFDSIVQNTLVRRSVNGQESRRLIQTRDRLLPRLLSGELKLD